MKNLREYQEDNLRPSTDLVNEFKDLQGDILVLGAGGKMGPDLARLAKNALNKAGKPNRVIGVSRFSEVTVKNDLEAHGIETMESNVHPHTS